MSTMLKWLEWESVSGYPTCYATQAMYVFNDIHVWDYIESTYFDRRYEK